MNKQEILKAKNKLLANLQLHQELVAVKLGALILIKVLAQLELKYTKVTEVPGEINSLQMN